MHQRTGLDRATNVGCLLVLGIILYVVVYLNWKTATLLEIKTVTIHARFYPDTLGLGAGK